MIRDILDTIPARSLFDVRERLDALRDLVIRRIEATSPADDIVRAFLDLMEGYDPAMPGHGERTAGYAVAMGEALDLPDTDLRQLRWAALLHDLGRLLLPYSLLHKPGPLTSDEYALVQGHPRLGAELLEPFPCLRIPAVWIALHHERWDGWGYPYGLRGSLSPLGSRMLAVADTFDALTMFGRTGQPERMELHAAIRLLQGCAGTQLDPDLVSLFALLPRLEEDDGVRDRRDQGT